MPSPLKSLARRADGGMDLERMWSEWEQWRTTEEAAFAQRLREKVGMCTHARAVSGERFTGILEVCCDAQLG